MPRRTPCRCVRNTTRTRRCAVVVRGATHRGGALCLIRKEAVSYQKRSSPRFQLRGLWKSNRSCTYRGTTRLFSVLRTSTQRTTLVAGADTVVPKASRVGATVISECGGKQQRQWRLLCRPRQLQSACFRWQITWPQRSKATCSRIRSSCLLF